MTHTRKRIVTRGADPSEAEAAVIVIHGRGGSPEGMLTLMDEVGDDVNPERLAWIAPHADGSTWYPFGFMEPVERNEPWLSSALEWLGELVDELEGKGVPSERLAFVGFSQGACLSAEFVARNPGRYGAVAILSGGLIGPPATDFERRFGVGPDSDSDEPSGRGLRGTPVYLCCSDQDPHIPEGRVRESGRILGLLGADVSLRIDPGMGHTVTRQELDEVGGMLAALL